MRERGENEKWTPGPWRLGADLTKVCTNYADSTDYTSNGWAKCVAVTNHPHYFGIEQTVANGHLIKTAPCLYDSVMLAIDELKAWQKCATEAGLCVTSTPDVIAHLEAVAAAARDEVVKKD